MAYDFEFDESNLVVSQKWLISIAIYLWVLIKLPGELLDIKAAEFYIVKDSAAIF